MRLLAINGSPRKHWNTATLLEKTVEGARSQGAQADLVHLYDLEYKGCRSCFECKRLGGKNYGRCAVKDGLTPLLEQVPQCDALVLGTPVYYGGETGEMRSCLERLLFPYSTYTPEYTSIFPGKIRAAAIYTMNVAEEDVPTMGYPVMFTRMEQYLARIFGSSEILLCTDTYQFDDYAKYLSTRWDAAAKATRRAEVFPRDCARAFELGERLVAPVEA